MDGWPGELWIAILAVGALALFICLHAVSASLDNHARVAAFKREVKALRTNYHDRLKALRARGDAPESTSFEADTADPHPSEAHDPHTSHDHRAAA
ncbi:hypothetical protein BH11PLA1_BH11PLA1_06170 [soil metagenome]